MASFGAKCPVFAPFASTYTGTGTPTYDDKVTIGRLVKADLTVTLATGELYSDDVLSEQVSEFASGQIAMETDDMLDSVAAVVYGAEVDSKLVTYKSTDAPPYGGLVYYKVLQRNGKRLYKGYFYPKAKAALGNDTAQTRTNSITFGTTATTFTVFPLDDGTWRQTQEFATETEAKAWVNEKLAKATAENLGG